jgi:hypothetical protein
VVRLDVSTGRVRGGLGTPALGGSCSGYTTVAPVDSAGNPFGSRECASAPQGATDLGAEVAFSGFTETHA